MGKYLTSGIAPWWCFQGAAGYAGEKAFPAPQKRIGARRKVRGWRPLKPFLVASNRKTPRAKKVERHVFVVLILLDPVFQLGRGLVLVWLQFQVFNHQFKRGWLDRCWNDGQWLSPVLVHGNELLLNCSIGGR